MAFNPDDIRANRNYFAAKLRALKQKIDVEHRVKGKEGGDYLLLDARSRDAFGQAHIPGALCTPYEELDALVAQLPKDRELVVYCWNDY